MSDWLNIINDLETELSKQKSCSDWLKTTDMLGTISSIKDNLENELRILENSGAFVFSAYNEIENQTKKTIELFRLWTTHPDKPSLTALCIFAADHLNIHEIKLKKLLLVASFLGEIENTLAYHNNMHYRKVLFNIIRMIVLHNDIYEETSRQLAEENIAILMTAACIHDIGHDGFGNTIKGMHVPHRLEKNSFDIAAPLFESLNLTTPDMLDTILLMLICTDVTPLNDPTNTINQLKASYRFHFLGGKEKTHTLNLDSNISALETSAELTMLCMMLHEADIATSAGLHYNITKYETALLMDEIGIGSARPGHVLSFLNDICNRQMLLHVSQQLYAANLARIYALAEEDFQNGNLPYPRPEYSDFILGIKERNISKGSNAIN